MNINFFLRKMRQGKAIFEI